MKYIEKGAEPQELINFKNNTNIIQTYDSLGKNGATKEALFEALLKEQGSICCYCEQELKNEYYHVEHLKPKDKDKFPELQLDYANLVCSCLRNLEKGTPRHCGFSKDNWYNEEEFISPLDPTCETKFKYSFNGLIYPSDENDNSAIKTIEILKLNIDKLNDLRSKAIEPFLSDELTEDELKILVNDYLKKKDEKFNEFYTTIEYLFVKNQIQE